MSNQELLEKEMLQWPSMTLNQSQAWQTLLNEYGVRTIAWPGIGPAKGEPETVTILSDEMGVIEQGVISSNTERTRFEVTLNSDALKKRGFEKIWVHVMSEPHASSKIHLKMRGVVEPLVVTKPYNR